jgi:chromosomal replication initiator protein
MRYNWDYPVIDTEMAKFKKKRETKEIRLARQRKLFSGMDHSRLEYITKIVCQVFNLEISEVKGRNNFRPYVEARQTAMTIGLKEKKPQWYVGAFFDWRDHSTVIHARETVDKTLQYDLIYLEKLAEILTLIKSNAEPKCDKIESINDINYFN